MKIPLYYVRGGTSSGIVVLKDNLPNDKEKINNIMRRIFGVPLNDQQKFDPYQLEGIGKGKSTSNKAFIIDIDYKNNRIKSTFLQLEANTSEVSWNVNCGNMTSVIPLVLNDLGVLKSLEMDDRLHIYNTNTRKSSFCNIYKDHEYLKCCKIAGVENEYPQVDISFKDPIGSVTGQLFPTGSKVNIIDSIEVTCIDVVVPMIIIQASSLGLKGTESKEQILEMDILWEKINRIKIQASKLMKLKNKNGELMTNEDIAQSMTIPKVSIISKDILSESDDISMIYFTPKELHNSVAVSGGCCLAYACGIEGTVASKLFFATKEVKVKHYAGISTFGFSCEKNQVEVYTTRNAQIYMKGEFYLY